MVTDRFCQLRVRPKGALTSVSDRVCGATDVSSLHANRFGGGIGICPKSHPFENILLWILLSVDAIERRLALGCW